MKTLAPLPAAVLWLLSLLPAAAPSPAHAGDVVIEIDPASIVMPDGDAPAPPVEVSDIRDSTTLERTTIGQVSLGRIEVVPPLPELVGAIVAAKVGKVAFEVPAGGEPPVIYCGLRRFTVETPATLLYWDIESRIEVVLRVGDQDREVVASAKERTWVYPSKKLLEKVTREALLDLADGLGPALTELAIAPPPEEPEARAEAEAEAAPAP